MAENKPQIIDLSKLGLEQLTALKNQLDQEINFFSESLQQLKIVQGKFIESGDCIEKLTVETTGHDLLVPLTSCMYAPGRIKDAENFILDVGTGYYVEKNRNDSIKYFDRKVKFVTEQMEKIQKIASEKSQLREVVMDMMEIKVTQQITAMREEKKMLN